MADVHRKIELQEPEDLRYLVNNTRRAANQMLNENLPPIEGEDPYRNKVEMLVNEYITSTFIAASANILINGQAPSQEILESILFSNLASAVPQVEEHEPLDNKLNEKATQLKKEEDALIEEIANLKRSVHAKAVIAWNESHKAGLEADELAWKEAESFKDGDDVQIEIGERERQAWIEDAWGRGVEGLTGLKIALPGTMAKMERAKGARDYVLKEVTEINKRSIQ